MWPVLKGKTSQRANHQENVTSFQRQLTDVNSKMTQMLELLQILIYFILF